jgi:hypothetical protein
MAQIPDGTAEGLIRLNLRPGSVFRFAHGPFSTPVPHFFVVLNHLPLSDPELVMVHATSNIAGARRRCASRPGTLVELTPSDYPDSAIDCGMVTAATAHELAEKFARNELELCADMDPAVVARLRTAVRASSTVERKYQKMLIEQEQR